MPDSVAEFFDGLARRGHVPTLKRITGSIRFDISRHGELDSWRLSITRGDVVVAHDAAAADCVISTDVELFSRMVTGEVVPLSAWLRNQLAANGRLEMIPLLGRIFPGPPSGHDPRTLRRRAERGAASLVSILDGNTFAVSDDNGDIEASPVVASGLFSFDTRFLSCWKLTVNGKRLQALSVDKLQFFETRFFLIPEGEIRYVDATISVIRERSVSRTLDEKLTVFNHDRQPVELRLRLDVDCDFADVTEIRKAIPKKGNYETRIEDGRLRICYRRERFRREVVITSAAPAETDENGFTWKVSLGPQQEWTTDLQVLPAVLEFNGTDLRSLSIGAGRRTKSEVQHELTEWLDNAPRFECDWKSLESTYHRSLVDLAALRFAPLSYPGHHMPAAGLPWFMSIFGRDSILTSLQALPFAAELAATTLRVLALDQGSRVDDFREEEPGKILREFRYGESSAFEEQPHSPYFGAADTTPLFVVLLDEYERWTGDTELVVEFQSEARAALTWIDEYGNLMRNGYVSYRRRNEQTGLENQCWKDSWNSISYQDGRIPAPLRATCELQGYAYDAKKRGARLARTFWNDPTYAQQLEQQAEDLKRRFNQDFWVTDGDYYALALDANGDQVNSLSSNIGHLLWSGIVDQSRAAHIVEHLMGPRLFSGWGIRTLATGEGRYNPVGYHVGTVWPFDNSFIAWGLRRYGYKDQAARIAQGILEAADYFQGRLPEAFAGYHRDLTRYPVQYPTACIPQAWSTGAPLLLLRTMLGMEPSGDRLTVDPALPPNTTWIGLLNVPGRWGRSDAYGRGHAESVPSVSRAGSARPPG